MSDKIEAISNTLRALYNIPMFVYKDELEGLYGSTILAELQSLLNYYKIYEDGATFPTEGSNADYEPSQVKYKNIKSLIDKEARFLFSRHPDFTVQIPIDKTMSATQKQQLHDAQTQLQSFLVKVLKQNNFFNKLVKAAKDCFIAKRVAVIVNFNERGIQINFASPLEFIYETDPENDSVITKFVVFYQTVDTAVATEQRIYKKRYSMGEDGLCYIDERVYDGTGTLVEPIAEDLKTELTFIPAFVILNDGLTGDLLGQSEVELLKDYEEAFSRLANADIDAERKGMNPVRYAIDMNPTTTHGLSTAAGAFWDLVSDDNGAEAKKGSVGVLTTPMEYSSALSTTLDRLKNTMHSELEVPNVSPEALKGVVSSGKTLKAIYWGLIVRCDEKMLSWRPALEKMAETIIEGAKLYSKSAAVYTEEALPDETYSILVENQYPLLEDEAEEKQLDLAEVQAQTMSRKAYMMKWRGLTEEEAAEELKQLALERQTLEESYMFTPGTAEAQVGDMNGAAAQS